MSDESQRARVGDLQRRVAQLEGVVERLSSEFAGHDYLITILRESPTAARELAETAHAEVQAQAETQTEAQAPQVKKRRRKRG